MQDSIATISTLVKRNTRPGFTIVELLVVIVVITILATITIVAYNGVQAKARASAVSSALSQVSKKLAVYSIDNADSYPATLADADISNTTSTTYQYTVNNTTNPRTYCTTATNATTSYYINNTTAPTPTSGGCPGDGVGGVPAITNLITNPSFETGVTGWAAYIGVAAPTTIASTPWSGSARLSAVGNNTSAGPRVYCIIPVSTGDSIFASARVRSDGQIPTSSFFVIKTKLNGTETGTVVAIYNPWAPDGNGWMLASGNYTVPVNVDALMILPGVVTASNYTGTLGVDAVMAIKGSSQANYADGNSPNWIWNGTPNASTSTGSPL